MLRGAAELRLYTDADSRRRPPRMRRRQSPVDRVLPGIGLMACWCVLGPLFVFMILRPLPAKGFRVDWKVLSAARGEKNPWRQSVGVYVESGGVFRVGGEGVSRTKLKEKLLRELGQQAVWVVYVEADSNAKFGDVVYAMGTVEDLGAKVVWITPGVRAGWKKERRE